VRLLFGLGVLVLAALGGCGDSRGKSPDSGGAAANGGKAGAGAGGTGASGTTSGAGGDKGEADAGLGGIGMAGTGDTAVCACDSTTPECELRIADFCLFQTAHCPPTVDETLHAVQKWGGVAFGKYYTECADGVRLVRLSLSFEGGYDIAYAADGSVLYAAGPRPDIPPPICGSFPELSAAERCRTCRVPLADASGEGGAGGMAGDSAAGGVTSAGAGATSTSLPDCLIDATGAVALPPE
jgi:hypothetical protein